jgi:hypothetical protein
MQSALTTTVELLTSEKLRHQSIPGSNYRHSVGKNSVDCQGCRNDG